ncbi:MAG: amidohydrolase family protein [Planctomycetota bacterium]
MKPQNLDLVSWNGFAKRHPNPVNESDTHRSRVVSRRTSLGLMAGLCVSARASTASDSIPETMVVDTHLHCFAGPEDSQFPYHPRAPYRPTAKASPERLLARMDGAGVDRAIVVHPEPYQDDHRYLDHCLDVGGGRLKGTCLFFADRPTSLNRLQNFLHRQGDRIIATRLHAYAPKRLPPWGKPEMDRLWKIATDQGVAMQIHLEPRYARMLDPYVRRYPKTRVIIDHMGRPMQGTIEEHDVVLRWSELPNTIMKLASIPRQDQFPHRDPAPVIRRLAELWGADRLIYGGGFNADATDDSYRQYRTRIASMLTNLSSTDQAKVFGGNATRLFGFS